MLKSENFEHLLTTLLKKVYEKTYNEIPSRLAQIFNVMSSEKSTEYFYSMGDIGLASPFDGQITYKDTTGQYRTQITPSELCSGLRIQRKLMDDEMYNVIKQQPALLARSMKLRKETDASSVFSNAFNSGYVGGDAVCLCSASHPALADPTPSVQSNTGTASMTVADLKAIRLAMMKVTTNEGNRAGVRPDMLLCPIDLADTAAEHMKSEKVPYKIENTINVQQGRFSVMDWDFLTDTNNYFMIDSGLMKQYLLWLNRIETEFAKAQDSDTFVYKYSTYARYGFGWADYKWVNGQNVS